MTAFKRHGALAFCALFLLAAACGGDKDAGGGEAAHEEGDHDHSTRHGGHLVESSDHKAHFEIVHDEKEGAVMLYLYDGGMKPAKTSDAPVLNLMVDGNPISIKGSGKAPTGEWAFVHAALKHDAKGRFRVKMGGKTFTPEFGGDHGDGHDDDDHGHEDGHEHGEVGHGPHDGMVTAFEADGKTGGYVELKLHDDKGDLELWIAQDKGIEKPFDLSLGATITVTFVDRDGKQVTLKVRNKATNEDEDGKANVRKGMTNYFIFPGDSGADAAWLMGADFECGVKVSFKAQGSTWSTDEFTLKPHTHGAHGHEHD